MQALSAEIGSKHPEFWKIASTPEVRETLRQANDKYLHWDDFRHKPMPAGVSPEEAWLYLKWARVSNMKPTPIKDKAGAPFYYWTADPVLKALNEIDRWSGQMIGAADPSPLPEREKYIISQLMDEAIASSQMEGAATTRDKAKEMLRTGRRPESIDEKMILNNWRTIQHLREHAAMKMTPDVLREIHALVTRGTLDNPEEVGQFRKSNDIYVSFREEEVHTPPRHEELQGRIKAFCDFANQDDEESWIHPVLKGIMLHFWLAYDHPFTDGNGRTARALFYRHMLSRGYWLFEYLPLSRYFLRAPAQYVRAYLYTETDDNDLTYFLAFNLRAIRLAFRDLQKYLERKQEENAVSSELLRNHRGLNLRQKNLVLHAIRHPNAAYLFQTHRNLHGIAYDTARRDLLHLEKKGFLKREKQGKAYVFVPADRMMDRLRR